MSQSSFWRRAAQLAVLTACLSPPLGNAKLTTEQKLSDFKQLVAFYERYYAPAQWKKEISGFDLTDEAPWLARVANTTDDLGMVELCVEYVASLNDSHSFYQMARNEWRGSLGFEVGIYKDGAVDRILIDKIDRARMPAVQYPFQVGDELVSLDGISAEAWTERLLKWTHGSAPRFKRSMAAMGMVKRQQTGGPFVGAFPRAPLETGDTSAIVVRQLNGNLESYTVAWQKSGTPMLEFGPVTNGLFADAKREPHWRLPELKSWVANPGAPYPAFALPANFQLRIGLNFPFDPFYIGTFEADGLRLGYMRIASFSPGPPNIAILERELAYLQANTDGLVLDIMFNSGGSGDYGDQIFAHLSPVPYKEVLAVWRPSLAMMNSLLEQIEQLRVLDPVKVPGLEAMLESWRQAYLRGDVLTDPVPIAIVEKPGQPATDPDGNIIAYTKPIMLLTNEWSISAADGFASQFQDNRRGPVFGTRTNGAGGVTAGWPTGSYAQGETGAELNLVYRRDVINAPGYPPTHYVDNVGVHPDIVEDFMTRENLLNGGAIFSQRMVAAMVQHVRSQQ